MSTSKWTVSQWRSHPDLNNDDCQTADDFDTLEEAKASRLFINAPYYIEYLEIDGPKGSDHYELVRNPRYDAKRVRKENDASHAEWRREQAMQAGMGWGAQAYNEAMGWDTETD